MKLKDELRERLPDYENMSKEIKFKVVEDKKLYKILAKIDESF